MSHINRLPGLPFHLLEASLEMDHCAAGFSFPLLFDLFRAFTALAKEEMLMYTLRRVKKEPWDSNNKQKGGIL